MRQDLFPKLSVRDVTLKQKVDELTREIKVRRHVYPRWVEQRKINCVTADIRITILLAIRNDYRQQLKKELKNDNQETTKNGG